MLTAWYYESTFPSSKSPTHFKLTFCWKARLRYLARTRLQAIVIEIECSSFSNLYTTVSHLLRV